MQSDAKTVSEYIKSLPADRQEVMKKLIAAIEKNIPKGFEKMMQYGMMGWAVPHSLYPAGYHCDPKIALPFMGLASQKNSVNFYHMGVYSDPALYKWFTTEYPKRAKKKLDMGKSCVRFKDLSDIPYDLIGELAGKITPKQWIAVYEERFKK